MKNDRRVARSRRGRSRMRPFALVAVFAVLLLGVGFAWAASWPGFRPRSVVVYGNLRVPTSRILAAAAVDPRMNMWLQSSSGIESRVLRIRSIARVSVHRYLPNRLSIVVRERRPVARLVAEGGRCAVDRRGYIFPNVERDRALPAVLSARNLCAKRRLPEGSTTMRLLALLRRADEAGVRLATLTHDRYGEERGVLVDGTLLYIGDGTHLARKFAEVRALEERLRGTWKNIKALDLRAPSTPIVVEGRKVEGEWPLSVSAMKGRGRPALHRSPEKTSSSRSRAVSKNPRSGDPQRASSPVHSASSP